MAEPSAALPRMGGNLSSLAQSAREKSIRTARNIMIFIGVLTILANGVLFFLLDREVKSGVEEVLKMEGLTRADVPGEEIDRMEKFIRRMGYLIYGGSIGLGITYLLLAAFVKKHPVPITITALVLYLAAAGIFALLDPATLLQGVVIKIIIVIALIRSVSAAIAYEKARTAVSVA